MNFIRLSWNSHLKSKKMYTIVKSRCNLVPEREFIRWMLLLVTIWLKCVLSASASSIDVSPSPPMPTAIANCSLVAHIFEARGISTAEIPRKPINDKPLRYCESSVNGSCCTPSMEIKLVSHTKQQLEKTTRDSISKLSSILSTRAVKFNEFFGQLLAESKKEFHLMFKRTYGVIYEENAYVFSDLFNELEKYYSRGKVDLAEAMDSFFNTLYQKMFTVLNSQYAFDDKYLGCVSEHMKELKPFGDVPDKLSVQIKRSFVATRTFAQALFTASDVAKKVMSIRPSENCTAALIKMQQCNVCKGYTEKPCANYCISVMKGCLSYYNELDIEWDNFVAAMDKVSERLIGPFNIVVVVEPINIKISEAIMNFQETGTVIANQVFQGCGRPNLGRPKREIIEPKTEYNKTTPPLESSGAYDTLDIDASLENEIIVIDRFRRSADISNDQQYKSSQAIDAEQQQNDGKGRRRNKKKHSNRNEDDEDEANKEPILDKLVKDIRQKVKDSKKFWSNLPNHICDNDDIAAPSNTDKPCWNGHTVERYKYSITADQTTNADFHVTQTTSRHVANQLYYLKTAISNLKNAYNGMDVEWSDQDEPYYGSGSGSGEGIDEEEGSGSGLSAFEDTQTNDPIHMETPSVRVHTQNISSTTSGTVYTPSHETTGTDKTSSKASRMSKMSLRQAIITYLFPIYILWFGGIISDLL